MEFIFNKLILISKFNKLNENFMKYESVVEKLKPDYNVNKINNNSMKMFKISVECNAFDVNEDKQRQCYKQLKCFWPKCQYSAEYLHKLNRHISHHLNKRQFVCEECNKQFLQKSTLLEHKRFVHSTDRPFVCNQINCNKRFKTNSHRIQHKSTHSSVKSFSCDECDKRFKTNSDLSSHKKFVHSNIRPFICPQNNCNKRYKRKSQLKEHKRIHCSDKPFECEECNRSFKYKSYLTSHKLIHSNIKPFKCNVNNCNKSFRQRNGLSKHKMGFHIGIKRHKCIHNNCDKSFLTSVELKLHIGYKHSTERPFIQNVANVKKRE